MDDIESKLTNHGQKREYDELQEFISNVDTEELCNFITLKMHQSSFIKLWGYLLQSFAGNVNMHKQRYRIVKHTLKRLRETDISNQQTNSIINRLATELPKFKSSHLIKFVEFCIECIQQGNVSQKCWKDLLPEVLNILNLRDQVEHCDTEMSGAEYKTQVIKSLCVLKWSSNIIITLASMFIDIHLTKEEHLKVINKLGQCMDSLTAQEIPPLVHQMLLLCRKQNGKIIFFRLQNYFNSRLYLNNRLMDSETTNMDSEPIDDASELETIQAESTTLFYINQATLLGNGCIKEYLNSLKILTKSPEYILQPFQLIVLLSISCTSTSWYSEQVFDLIRYSVSRSVNEDQKRLESAWFREMVPSKTDIDAVFGKILNSNLRDRDLVAQGLVNLGFILLGTSTVLGRESYIPKQWHLGQLILVKLVKRRNDIAPTVLKMLRDKVLNEHAVSQYTECLYQLCYTVPLVMVENQNIIMQMVDKFAYLPSAVAKLLVAVIVPLVRISNSIRDILVLALKKALFARDIGARQMAVFGFLQIVKTLKVRNLVALSQSSEISSTYSAHSVLTQISMECRGAIPIAANRHTNEVLCLEILNVLRRCFMLQAEVKSQLYEGLYEAICDNPELNTLVIDLLFSHFKQFYVEDEDTLPPLNFDKCTILKDADVILQEPLGELIFTIGMVISKTSEQTEHPIRSLNRLNEMLESIIKRMIKCEILNFQLDDGTDVLDILPECQKRHLELKQILTVYEALMGFIILSWTEKAEGFGQKLVNLFKAYTRITDFVKTISKPKKAEGTKRKKDDSTQKKQQSIKMQSFKNPSTVLNMRTVHKFLCLLHKESVEWTSKAQTSVLKSKREFHRYVMQVTLELIQMLKSMKPAEIQHNKTHLKDCTKVAQVLYERCVKRLNDFANFDRQTATMATEVFYNILTFVSTHYKNYFSEFLCEVGSLSSDETLPEQIVVFMNCFENLLENVDEEADDEQGTRKMPVMLINCLSLLISQIPASDNVYVEQILDWLKKYIDEHETLNRVVAIAVINLIISTQLRCRSDTIKSTQGSALYDNVAVRLCKLMGTIDHERTDCPLRLKIINEGTMLPTTQALCAVLKSQLDDVDWVIWTLKADHSMIVYNDVDGLESRKEKLKSNESDLCCHMCQIVEVATTLSNVAIPTGTSSDSILKVLTHLYNTMSCLTKYFILRSSKGNLVFQHARFERVVKLAGKQLLTNVYNMILYIEESQQQEDKPSQQKKKKSSDPSQLKSKVLRETRLIPKVIYEIEQFGKCVIQLSKKTNEDLMKYMKHGTSRDFKIKAPALQKALENLNNTVLNATVDNDNESDVSKDKSNEDLDDKNDSDATTNETNALEDDDVSNNEEPENVLNENSDNDSPEIFDDSDAENVPPSKKRKI